MYIYIYTNTYICVYCGFGRREGPAHLSTIAWPDNDQCSLIFEWPDCNRYFRIPKQESLGYII